MFQKFQQIVDVAEGVVVFSFGSVAPSHKMPMSWKLAFIDAFKRFPKYHFIWRYEGMDLKGKFIPYKNASIQKMNWML